MNFYLEALQDEHLLLKDVLNNYCAQIEAVGGRILEKLESGVANRLLFCGMGSSLYAAMSILSPLNCAGLRAELHNCYALWEESLDMIDAKTIVIAISQSGNTPEVLSLVAEAKLRAAMTVCMINMEDSALKDAADGEILLKMGRETPISNKTYYAQVAQMNLLSCKLLKQDLQACREKICAAIDWHDTYLQNWQENTQALADALQGVSLCDVLGDGAQLGAAMQAGLVMREMGRIPVCAHSLSDYNHGWFDIADSNYAMIILADVLSDNDRKMIGHCAGNGGKALCLLPGEPTLCKLAIPRVERSLLPMYTIVPLYFLSGMFRGV